PDAQADGAVGAQLRAHEALHRHAQGGQGVAFCFQLGGVGAGDEATFRATPDEEVDLVGHRERAVSVEERSSCSSRISLEIAVFTRASSAEKFFVSSPACLLGTVSTSRWPSREKFRWGRR